MDSLWITLLILVINFWDSSAITNKNNRLRAQDGPVRNFRHVGTTAYTNTDWEVGLREATNQALLREKYHAPNLRERLLRAPLIGKEATATPFGDIVIVARGQLYVTIEGDFAFVQDPYQNDCEGCHTARRRCVSSHCGEQAFKPHQDERLVALWTVKRLRHRDYVNGYRYETEYTISPIGVPFREVPVNGNHGIDYTIPGHVFVVKHDIGAASTSPEPPLVAYNQRLPHNHFRPEVLIGVGPDGRKHFLHSYPGFYTSFPVHPTHQSTNDPREIELYKALIEALASKTSTTQKIEDGPHRFSLNHHTTEDSFTPLVQLPTGEMVPLTHITPVTITKVPVQFPATIPQEKNTKPIVLQMVPTKPTDLSNSEVVSQQEGSAEPEKHAPEVTHPITSVHYFAPADEERLVTPGEAEETEKMSSTHKTTQQIEEEDGADFLFPVEKIAATTKTTKKHKPAYTTTKFSKTGTTGKQINGNLFPEPSPSPTRQSKVYHATFSAKNTSFSSSKLTTSSEDLVSKHMLTMKMTSIARTTPATLTTTPTTTEITSTTTKATTTATKATHSTTKATASTTKATLSTTKATSTTTKTTPTTTKTALTTMLRASASKITPKLTTSIKSTAEMTPFTFKLPLPTNIILKTSTSKQANGTNTELTTPKATTRKMFPTLILTSPKTNMRPTFTLSTSKESTVTNTTPLTKLPSVGKTTATSELATTSAETMAFKLNLTTPVTVISNTTPSELTTAKVVTDKTPPTTSLTSTTAPTTLKASVTPTSEIPPPSTTQILGKNDSILPIKSQSEQQTTLESTYEGNKTSITKLLESEATTVTSASREATIGLTSPISSATSQELTESDYTFPKYSPTTPMKMTLKPDSKLTSQLQPPSHDADTTVEFSGTVASTKESASEMKEAQTTSVPQFTTFKTVMTSMLPPTTEEITSGTATDGFDGTDSSEEKETTEQYIGKMINNYLTTTESDSVLPTDMTSTVLPITKKTTASPDTYDFLSGDEKIETVFRKLIKEDYSEDDIFGSAKENEKPTMATTSKVMESKFAGELFGNRRRSPKVYGTDSSLTRGTRIIFSDFYEASTASMKESKEETSPGKVKPLTSQSYATSISFMVNKKNNTKITDSETHVTNTDEKNASIEITTQGEEDQETRKAFNEAALQLVNHVRSINYLNAANNTSRAKYKRRRNYITKSRKMNVKRKH